MSQERQFALRLRQASSGLGGKQHGSLAPVTGDHAEQRAAVQAVGDHDQQRALEANLRQRGNAEDDIVSWVTCAVGYGRER